MDTILLEVDAEDTIPFANACVSLTHERISFLVGYGIGEKVRILVNRFDLRRAMTCVKW